jgi:ketosteroid isomerase-like protein
MSQANVDAVRGLYDGWMSGDVERALECVGPEVVWEAIADAPDAGTYRGHAGVRRYMEDWLADFDFVPMEFKEVIDDHDRLVITQCGRAIGKGSGVETEIHYAVAYRLADGRITEIKEFRTKEEALEAAGLAEREVSS